MDKRPALVTVTRHPSFPKPGVVETYTYKIEDPEGSGYAMITLDLLKDLFRLAGIEPEETK